MAKSKAAEWLTEDGLLRLEAWARDGLTDAQIAHNMGVSTVTLYDYKNKHVNIFNALKSGKEVIDIQVENSLFKRAMGYKYTEVTKERIVDPVTMESRITVTKEVIKEVAPDVTAQIFWLKNRKPKEWRDKQDIEHSGEIKMPTIVIGK